MAERSAPGLTDIVERLSWLRMRNTSRFARRVIDDAIAELHRLTPPLPAGLDYTRRCVIDAEGAAHKLREKDFMLLSYLCEQSGRVVRLEELFNHLWGNDIDGGPNLPRNNIQVHLVKIRRVSPWPIVAVHGVGLRLEGYAAPKPTPELVPEPFAGISRSRLMAGR